MLTLLLGGARSGKSALAVKLASARGAPVSFIATAEARDREMTARIAEHRAGRPLAWSTVEEPVQLGQALASIAGGDTVVIDCLTLWVSNMIERGANDSTLLSSAGAVAALAAERPGTVVAVSNEVGSGIVPVDALSRHYRDMLGLVNGAFAERATEAFLVVAGRALALAAMWPPASTWTPTRGTA